MGKARLFWTDYRTLSMSATAIMGLLCATLLLTPGLIDWLFQIDSGHSEVMSGRAAMLFLGLAVITYQARDTPDSAARRAIAMGMMAAMGALALVGLYDFLRGAVGFGIWLAIALELAIVAAFNRFRR